MELYIPGKRRPAIAITALAAAGLVLAGCASAHGSASTSATTQSSSTAQAPGNGSGTSSGGSGTVVMSSGSLPFPSTAGDTWFYRNSNGTTSENKVKSVTPVSSGQKVLMESVFKDNGTTTHSSYSYIFQPDGKITLPLSQFTSSASAGFSVKLISGGVYWPSAAELASGKSYDSTMTLEYTIEGKTQKSTMHSTTTGGGTQSVTVPAGTYTATVVNTIESESLMGTSITTEVRTWLANGVGPVQSELINVDGTTRDITNKEELTSFIKG